MSYEPTIKFDFNQKFLVALESPEVTSIPCLTHIDHKFREIPRLSWITYKGLANMLGRTYMRFEFDKEDVLLSFEVLRYLEEVPHRFPGKKTKYVNPNNKKSAKKSPGKKYITYGQKPKKRRKRKKRRF